MQWSKKTVIVFNAYKIIVVCIIQTIINKTIYKKKQKCVG